MLTADEELLSLWALDPELARDLQTIFGEAVTDAIANLLPQDVARTLALEIGAKNFRSPRKVAEVLDSILRDGSEPLKHAIAEEFRKNVHLLWEKLTERSAYHVDAIVVPRTNEH
jgi:hypothetical protein